ncbi:hypothetical protein CR513_26438, partial [Mucuna pruriens]
MNNNASSFAYVVESINHCHGRLEHDNIDSIKRLSNVNLLSPLKEDLISKYPICIEVKHTKTPFKLLILKIQLVEEEKKYYITFIDDHSQYTKVYLLELRMKLKLCSSIQDKDRKSIK